MQVDVVYTWVNHRDHNWIALYSAAMKGVQQQDFFHSSVNSLSRFKNRNEIVYSIKSVRKYAPWVSRIYIVTNCELPDALKLEDDVIPIAHEEIFPCGSTLPTFNSRAIESTLHNIPGLSENFLYFNDDVFLCRPVEVSDFFPGPGLVSIYPSRHDIPYGVKNGLRPVDFGILNACEILIRDFGYTPSKKLHHAPFALCRSTMKELENMYSAELDRTRSHPFRDMTDLPLATTLHAYYSLATGRGVMKNMPARYIDISLPWFVLLVHRFSPLRRGRYAFLCLNEVNSPGRIFAPISDFLVRRLMRAMFESH